MKNTYITPELLVVELRTRNHLMEVSIASNRNISVNSDESNVGLTKGDNDWWDDSED